MASKQKRLAPSLSLKPVRVDSYYNKRQLEIGTKIEMEHTTNPKIAKRIAKHHLDEYKSYYRELVKMEKKLEKKKG